MAAVPTSRDAQYQDNRDRAHKARQVFSDRHRVVERYDSGESVKALATDLGVTRRYVSRLLEDAGIEQRGTADANRLMMTTRTAEENSRNAAAAHAAVRGRVRSLEEKCQAALTREVRQTHVSDHERWLAEQLRARGLDVTPQKAVGPYNVDVATGTVAVEVFGGGWHAYGLHRSRSPERLRYILDQGWNLVIVWTSATRWAFTDAATDYLVAFAEETSRDPSMRGQYRVIWGDGKAAPVNGLEVDDLSVKPSRSGRRRPRS